MYQLLELYVVGIIKGALTARAGSISFSFFMALFPFLLFVLNLIPFIPTVFSIENFDLILLDFIETLLPAESHGFFNDIFNDIQSKPRGGLLSSVFLLSIFLSANGVNSIFTSFEVSYHVKELRNIFKQYLYALGVSVLLAFMLLVAVISFIYFELAFKKLPARNPRLGTLGAECILYCLGLFFYLHIVLFRHHSRKVNALLFSWSVDDALALYLQYLFVWDLCRSFFKL